MFQHEFKKRVRYGETDQMGYLYYGNYAQYYEIGRVEMLRSLGFSYRSLETDYGVMMPVMSMNTRYVRPALYDDLVTIRTILRQLPERYIIFDFELFNEAGELLNGGRVKLCFVDIKKQETVHTPRVLLDKLQPYFEEN